MIKVKKDLQKRVETFLNTYPSSEEYGGFLFANRLGNISDFLVIPNVHTSRTDTYRMPDTAMDLATKLAKSKKLTLIARWHNHPTPAVCSVQDCHSAEHYNSLYSVMISPTGSSGTWKKDYIWYFYKGVKPEKVSFV
jgi:proteasome lid subunit RPN8/RPN11